ncbi:MAG: ion transporter [Bacteroidales bacterium]|nr:ion transporter [Bacteroidales bacterium]
MTVREKIAQIIEPVHGEGSLSSRIYDYFMLVTIVASILPLMFRVQQEWMVMCDKITCLIFIIDYLMRWMTADIESKTNSKKAFLLYPFSFMAIVDLLSILPSVTMLNASFKVLRVARMLKILRVVRFFRYYSPLQIMINVIRKEADKLLTVLVFAVFYIFITALIMFNVEEPINPATGEYLFDTFFDAIYWAACTLTTVGYGDICPVSGLGRTICMLSAIVGVAIIALPSGVITAGYMDEVNARKEKKNAK